MITRETKWDIHPKSRGMRYNKYAGKNAVTVSFSKSKKYLRITAFGHSACGSPTHYQMATSGSLVGLIPADEGSKNAYAAVSQGKEGTSVQINCKLFVEKVYGLDEKNVSYTYLAKIQDGVLTFDPKSPTEITRV